MSLNSLPAEFVRRTGARLGDEMPAFLAALADPPAGLRVNGARLDAERFLVRPPFAVRRLSLPADGYLIDGPVRPGLHPYHAAGVYYLQDPSAMVVGALAAPSAGEHVLDLCAAPGGKASQLAAPGVDGVVLVANDVHAGRARELSGNLERLGVGNAIVTVESPTRLAKSFGPAFDRVLIDAPCSGEAMFGHSSGAVAAWSPAAVRGCARRQADLFETAAALVRPGGQLIYSTCTFSDEENEEVVGRFLDRRPDFAPGCLGPVPGAEVTLEGVGGCASAYRLWPHRVPGAGHFVAALVRRLEGPPLGTIRRRQRSPGRRSTLLDRRTRLIAEEAIRDLYPHLSLDLDRMVDVNGDLRLPPSEAPPVEGLRILRSGVHLGRVRSGRFEPDHALALTLPVSGASRRLDLELEDDRVLRYLSGHPLPAEGTAGWTLVTVDGFALGWGKYVAGVVKNHLPHGLRWLGRGG